MVEKNKKYVLDDSELNQIIYSPVCTYCKNLIDGIDRKCRAFDLIPDSIWNGNNNHTKPYPNDNGIQFEPLEKEDAE